MSTYCPARARKSANLPRIVIGALITGCAILPGSPGLAAAKKAPKSDDTILTPLQLVAQNQNLPKVKAEEVLRIAESRIGVTENVYGGGTEFQQWYMSSPRAQETLARDGGTLRGYANAPWCAMFVSWVGEKAGIRPVVGWDAYTVTWAKWFRNNRHWGSEPRPGAVVYFDWGGSRSVDAIDHVGLVKHDNGDGTITTIEGNTGNGSVERRVRLKSQVVGYGYPVYAS